MTTQPADGRQLAKRIYGVAALYAALAATYLTFTGCPPTPPVTPPTDASDAPMAAKEAPTMPPPPPALDAAPPSGDCAAACAAFTAAGCPQQADCPVTLAEAEQDRLIRLPSGAAFTCAAAKSAKTKADVVANGGSCAAP